MSSNPNHFSQKICYHHNQNNDRTFCPGYQISTSRTVLYRQGIPLEREAYLVSTIWRKANHIVVAHIEDDFTVAGLHTRKLRQESLSDQPAVHLCPGASMLMPLKVVPSMLRTLFETCRQKSAVEISLQKAAEIMYESTCNLCNEQTRIRETN